MRAEGLDPSVLDGAQPATATADASASTASPPSGSAAGPAAAAPVALQDDPRYSRYFKMLNMHLPKGAVAQKMSAEGLDAAVLDLDPTKPAPVAATSALGEAGRLALPKPKPAPKPAVVEPHHLKPTVKMRALYVDKVAESAWEQSFFSTVNLEQDTAKIEAFTENLEDLFCDKKPAKQVGALVDVELQ